MGSQTSEASGRVQIQIWLMSEGLDRIPERQRETEERSRFDMRERQQALRSEFISGSVIRNARTISFGDGMPRTLFPSFPRPPS